MCINVAVMDLKRKQTLTVRIPMQTLRERQTLTAWTMSWNKLLLHQGIYVEYYSASASITLTKKQAAFMFTLHSESEEEESDGGDDDGETCTDV